MTQQEFARMTAVIDDFLRLAGAWLAQAQIGSQGATARAISYEDAAADLLAALPVPEDK